MKTVLGVLTVASLGFNATLIVVLLVSRGDRQPAAAIAPKAAPPAAAIKPAYDEQTWPEMKTADLSALLQRLRERGFPPEIIRAILSAQLLEAYAARMKALDPDSDRRPYWKSYSIDPKVQVAQMQLYREQQKILRGLLGADADPQESVNDVYRGRRFDTVPREKLDDVQRILREFEEARSEAFGSSGGMIGAETQKKLANLDREMRSALRGVLSPSEFEDFQIRNSDTARNLRNELSAFNPTEAEFRALYRLKADFDERFPPNYGMLNMEEQERRSEGYRQLNEQIKATLGAVRGEEYQRASDYNYKQTSQLVARLELPAETTNKVYDVQKDIQTRMRDVARPRPDGPPTPSPELNALATEAEKRITALIGARGFEAYKQYGGSWMRALQPPAPPPAKK